MSQKRKAQDDLETKSESKKRVESTIQYWLMKAEAESRLHNGKDVKFSIDDLKEMKVSPWDGVRNGEAKNIMRDRMQVNDLVLFYHSNTKKPVDTGVAGIAKIVKAGYPDPSAFDSNHAYFDPKSDKEKPKWYCVDVEFVEKFPKIVPLKSIKAEPDLSEMVLVKRGRLSVQPVKREEFEKICAMGKE